MTERLYQQNGHLLSCTAKVLECTETENGFDIVLDRTVIFDNEGGQPCDFGTIGDARVLGCDSVDRKILHHADKALPVDSEQIVTLDWERRFDFMQQHTGEHILSYAAYKLFGVNNVGFHLSEEYTTIDLDRMLSKDQLEQAELLANDYVRRNLAVSSHCFDTEEELLTSGLPIRKQAEGLHTPIRIVQIEDCDCCTCCAPHCLSTGEVGQILVKDFISYKGGMRITFFCGQRALRYAQAQRNVLDTISRAFSTSYDQVPSALSSQQEELKALHKTVREFGEQISRYQAMELVDHAESIGQYKLVLSVLDSVPAERLKSLADKTLKESKTLTVLFSKGSEKLSYILMTTKDSGLDMGEFCQIVNAATGGKGGGRDQMAQGSSPNAAIAEDICAQLHDYFTKRLK